MISATKLRNLPRRLRLRKIANLLRAIEGKLERSEEDLGDSLLIEKEIIILADEIPSIRAAAPQSSAAEATVGWLPIWVAAVETADRNLRRRLLNGLRYAIYDTIGHQVADWDFLGSDGVLDPSLRKILAGHLIFLEDLRSPFNVGAIFRSAEAFGIESIALTPLCASPDHPRARRSAMGCIDLIPWERRGSLAKDQACFALETGGTDLRDFCFPEHGCMIVGSEELGISPEILAVADASYGRVSIRQWGVKGSLNVAVAVGIVLQAWAEDSFSNPNAV